MAKNVKKEEWINEVMDSTIGIDKAVPSDDLFRGIKAKLEQPQTIKIIPLPVRKWVAAAILLLALNISSVVYFTSHNKEEQTTTGNPLTSELQTGPIYNY